MKEKTKNIITSVLIGIVVFPTITLGGTFISFLIQGKTIGESVQILAQQIDSLIGRVEILETKEACNFADTALTMAQLQGGIISLEIKNFDDLVSKIFIERYGQFGDLKHSPPDQKTSSMWQSRLEKVQSLKEQYLVAKARCGE